MCVILSVLYIVYMLCSVILWNNTVMYINTYTIRYKITNICIIIHMRLISNIAWYEKHFHTFQIVINVRLIKLILRV